MQRLNHSMKAHLEIGILLVFVSTYLVVFNVTIPHGDALRVARQIEAKELIWNPNHLLFDPFGYAWHRLIHTIGLDISILSGFELISGIATIISLYIFHQILLALGAKNGWIRVMIVVGLFASKNFLSMSVSQYYFMLQMPFLLGALYCGIRFYDKAGTGEQAEKLLYAMGLLMAAATAIEINNVVPILFVGIGLIFVSVSGKPVQYTNALRFYGAAAALGVPIFIAGYLLSDTTSDFLSWIFAYEGKEGSSLTNYYGTSLTLVGILSSTATVVFHLLFGNFIETAGLGTILKVIVLGHPLEFVPDIGKLTLAALLIPVVAGGMVSLLVWSAARSRDDWLVRLNLLWVTGYLAFNFFWPYTSDLFWFQLLPFIWILVVRYACKEWRTSEFGRSALRLTPVRLALGYLLVSLVLLLNTFQTIIPVAWADMDGHQARHSAMLDDIDLEIIPGWDNYKWMMQSQTGQSTEKLLLMNMALKAEDDEQHISHLGNVVDMHLSRGARVVVGRLYALDRESNPWYGLADLGWPRDRIKMLLENFCRRPIIVIDDVSFHEIYNC